MKAEPIKHPKAEIQTPPTQEQTEVTEPTGESATSAKSTSTTQRLKRYEQKWRQSHQGLRHVWFVINSGLWDRFVTHCCSTKHFG